LRKHFHAGKGAKLYGLCRRLPSPSDPAESAPPLHSTVFREVLPDGTPAPTATLASHPAPLWPGSNVLLQSHCLQSGGLAKGRMTRRPGRLASVRFPPRPPQIPMAAGTPWPVVDFNEIDAVDCPCGTSQRALLDVPAFPGTIHRTRISADARPHFHRRLTETYYVLECDEKAEMQLDDQRIPIRPGTCIVIPPGVVHRAVGRMTILNIVFPKFDPTDEVLVDLQGFPTSRSP